MKNTSASNGYFWTSQSSLILPLKQVCNYFIFKILNFLKTSLIVKSYDIKNIFTPVYNKSIYFFGKYLDILLSLKCLLSL